VHFGAKSAEKVGELVILSTTVGLSMQERNAGDKPPQVGLD